VFASLGGRDDVIRMRRCRRGDTDNVDIVSRKNIRRIRDGVRVIRRSQRLRRLQRLRSARDDTKPGVRRTLGVQRTHHAAAYDADVHSGCPLIRYWIAKRSSQFVSSRKTSSCVSPNAEQYSRSGTFAM
jgi:hypothetical protein